MNAATNHQLSPLAGKSASGPIPGRGIKPLDDLGYVRYMDSWDALRRNLTSLLDAADDGLISGPTGVLQLEAATDIGKSTLYRILDPRLKNPTQLDTLERIAKAYNLQAWQLLIPRLDPLDPPAVIGGQRMSVLRSVFAQTHAEAFSSDETDKTQRATSTGARGTGNSSPAGRATAQPDGHKRTGRPRTRTNK